MILKKNSYYDNNGTIIRTDQYLEKDYIISYKTGKPNLYKSPAIINKQIEDTYVEISEIEYNIKLDNYIKLLLAKVNIDYFNIITNSDNEYTENGFQDEYRWLSNFHLTNIEYKGFLYPSVENAFQASKYKREHRLPFTACSPAEAKKLGRKAILSNSWNNDRVLIMKELVDIKFNRNSLLGNMLVNTYNTTLIEVNTWSDVYWGQCKGLGKNILGIMLMEQRDILRAYV